MEKICKEQYEKDFDEMFKLDKNGLMTNIDCYVSNLENKINNLQSKIDKAIEYLTSYEAISTIQGLDNIEKNKELDENTINIMTSRYLDVHHKLLDILKEE